MDLLNEILTKIPQMLRKTSVAAVGTKGLQKWGEANALKLENYYSFWRSRIQSAARDNRMLSNGWAFSTLSGLSSFESHIRATDIRSIYFNKAREIGDTLDAVLEQLGSRKLGGVILYGYGNLFREAYFVEQAIACKLMTSQSVYLIDCSLFYHVFAKSSLNPLRMLLKGRQIKPLLLDYVDDASARSTCIYVRDDLNPTRPVLHLFLGNTFCNVERTALQSTMHTFVRAGDFVVGEYAQYPEEFFSNNAVDYVSEMAKHAAAELFSVSPETVTAENITLANYAKATRIGLTPENERFLTFHSMLRRRFLDSELTDGAYELVSSHPSLNGSLRLVAFQRLPNNHT